MAEEGRIVIEPDPAFAAGWNIDDPIAQGAMKRGAVSVLDSLEEAMEELKRAEPDLEDFGPLGLFPRAIRAALTPLVVEKMRAAAIVVGWKLAQPEEAMPPGCLGEELALEMVRRVAIDWLEMAEAPQASIEATRGVYEVCEDDDVLDLFSMEEPSDAALARFNPINIQAGKADMRVAHWFDPFYGGGQGFAPHPLYGEQPASTEPPAEELRVVEPVERPSVSVAWNGEKGFRVIIRCWWDDWLELDEFERIPPQWVYYLDSSSAEAAKNEALELFPHGARQQPMFDNEDAMLLASPDMARISVDVQKFGLPQDFKTGSGAFHIVGDLLASLTTAQLGDLAGYLEATFPVGVVATHGERRVIGVTVNAESAEEAEADLSDALEAFGDSIGEEEELLHDLSCGNGAKERTEMLEELSRWAERQI